MTINSNVTALAAVLVLGGSISAWAYCGTNVLAAPLYGGCQNVGTSTNAKFQCIDSSATPSVCQGYPSIICGAPTPAPITYTTYQYTGQPCDYHHGNSDCGKTGTKQTTIDEIYSNGPCGS